MQPQVVTVLGQVPASTLGVVDSHEHLFLASPALPDDRFDDLDAAVAEVLEARDSGIGTIVEMTPIGLGRRPDLLREVARVTGVNIVAASGYHRDAHYPPGHWVHGAPVGTLTDRILTELEQGMHARDWDEPGRSLDDARAGAIKAGASYHHATDSERRRLEAAAIAARSTGVAVLVHCEIGTFGHEIVDLFEGWGVAPDRLLLAHMDRNPDAELHVEIASRGVTLEYDTIGRTKYHPDSVVLELIEAVAAAGHLDRVVVGLDTARRASLRAYGGGPGLRYLMARFVPRLRRRMGEDATERILVANPARAFAVAA